MGNAALMTFTEQSPPLVQAGRGKHVWWLAFALSIGVHAALLFGVPPLEFEARDTTLPRPLEARIVQTAAAPVPAAPSQAVEPVAPPPVAVPKPRPKPRPKPAARPDPPPPIALPAPPPPAPTVVHAEEDVAQAAQSGAGADAPTGEVAAAPSSSGGAIERQIAEPVAESTGSAGAATTPPPAAPARHPLKSATLVYDLSYGENPMRVGRVTHQWNNDGERYFAETVVEATGIFAVLYGGQYVQRSWGTFGPDGLVPSEYFVQRGRPDRGETALFDWEAKKVAFQWRNERRDAKLIAGTQDPISMLHQIYYMQPLPQAKTLNVASSRKFGAYLFQFIGEERIDTPMGELTALHVRRKDDDADHVDVWVDPQRGFLPVRVHFVDRRGYVFDQRVREMRFEAAP